MKAVHILNAYIASYYAHNYLIAEKHDTGLQGYTLNYYLRDSARAEVT